MGGGGRGGHRGGGGGGGGGGLYDGDANVLPISSGSFPSGAGEGFVWLLEFYAPWWVFLFQSCSFHTLPATQHSAICAPMKCVGMQPAHLP
jgi:hypothetical protein